MRRSISPGSIARSPNCASPRQCPGARSPSCSARSSGATVLVTEGTSTNAWIVTKAGELVTRQADNAILNGCTRLTLLDIAREAGLTFVERPFSLGEAKAAREAFLTSTTSLVLPIVRIDEAA